MGPLGILGGGQLGRMTLQAASVLGVDVIIAERTPRSPAARLTDTSLVFPNGWDDPPRLAELARLAPVVTLENEFVDARVLEQLEALGARVLPPPACVATVQDKLRQKQALAAAELPVPAFRAVERPADLARVGDELGWPLMLKARRDGYDGHGNLVVETAEAVESPPAAEAVCQRLGWPGRALMAEAFVPFERELAVIVVRDQAGACVTYPVVETRQDPRLHICREVLAPAPVEPAVAERAAEVARAAVGAVGGVGAFGVELFLLADGQVCVNELAPRPHNSGHYSIEACWSSQFDNHVRAVLGLGLADPGLRYPAAVMVNLLGSGRRGGSAVIESAVSGSAVSGSAAGKSASSGSAGEGSAVSESETIGSGRSGPVDGGPATSSSAASSSAGVSAAATGSARSGSADGGVAAFLSAAQLAAARATPGTYVHLYGKTENRPGRKLGHVTAVADTLEEALANARAAAAQLADAL